MLLMIATSSMHCTSYSIFVHHYDVSNEKRFLASGELQTAGRHKQNDHYHTTKTLDCEFLFIRMPTQIEQW